MKAGVEQISHRVRIIRRPSGSYGVQIRCEVSPVETPLAPWRTVEGAVRGYLRGARVVARRLAEALS